jgi:hypothetical protein
MARRTNTEIMNYAIALAAQEADDARADAASAREETQSARLEADAWRATARGLEDACRGAESDTRRARVVASSTERACENLRETVRAMRFRGREIAADLNRAVRSFEDGAIDGKDLAYLVSIHAAALSTGGAE